MHSLAFESPDQIILKSFKGLLNRIPHYIRKTFMTAPQINEIPDDSDPIED